jgi:hypothetical protein
MATHVKIIAVLFICVAVMFVVGAFFLPLMMGVLASLVGSSGEEGAAVGAAFLGFTGAVLSVMFGMFALPFGICGWGLLKLRPWARIFGIILAAVSLTQIPFGTLLGIYALIVLFQKDTEKLFAAAPA